MQSWPEFNDLLGAYRQCRLRKKPSPPQLRFEKSLGSNLLKLKEEIDSQRYKPSRSVCFTVKDPKPREIFAASFRDRIIHHLVISELEKFWLRRFSPHAFACLKDRGPHAALNYLQNITRRLSKGARKDVYALQLDIESFFISIHRPTLNQIVFNSLPRLNDQKSQKLNWLCENIFTHDARDDYYIVPDADLSLVPDYKSWRFQSKNLGLPIGNLTSQFSSTVLLTGLDHFVARNLKPQGYIRYMDDLLLLDRSPDKLKSFINRVDSWLQEERKQKLNPRKTKLLNLKSGITFLGVDIKQISSPSAPLVFHTPRNKLWKIVATAKHLESLDTQPELIDPIFALKTRKHIQAELAQFNSRLGLLTHTASKSIGVKVKNKVISKNKTFCAGKNSLKIT